MSNTDTLRHADLQTLATALNDQRTRTIDVVVPSPRLRSVLGAVELSGVDPVVSDDGVTDVNGCYVPTVVGDEGIAEKLKIPLAYLRRMHTDAVELYDANVSGWFARGTDSYLLRLLTHADGPRPDGSAGVLRAMLSKSYRTIDNFDVLLAALKGIQEAGVSDPVIEADLSERRMTVRVSTPDVAILAPKLLANYRSPFGGHDVGRGWTPERVARASGAEGRAMDPTIVFAGLVFSNSETGDGGFNVTPRLVIQVCNNGLTITADALKKVHLGAKLDDGVVQWSERTTQLTLALVTSKASDAVARFLDPAYLAGAVAKIEDDAAEPIADAPAVLATVSKRLGFTEADQALILGHFVSGGQMTAGGVMQAVTSAAQTIADPDAAWDMEVKGLPAMREAVSANHAMALARR